jgi:radical SAM superfamily enzyme YgiQ (UPF0313 family)
MDERNPKEQPFTWNGKKKILLITVPHLSFDYAVMPPLNITTLGGYLSSYYDVSLADLSPLYYLERPFAFEVDTFEKERIEAHFRSPEPELKKIEDHYLDKLDLDDVGIIGISIRGDTLYQSLMLAKRLKEETDAVIVFGGNSYEIEEPGFLDAYAFIDFSTKPSFGVFKTMKLICDHVLQGRPKLENIPSLLYRKDGKAMVTTISDARIPFRRIPAPSFDGLDLDAYAKLSESDYAVLPYYFATGCINSCAFCGAGKNPFDSKPIKQIINELRGLRREYESPYFLFLNNMINKDQDYVKAFCTGLIEAGLDILWSDSARPVGITPEIAGLMKKSGCIKLSIGLESGSQKILNSMKRGVTIAEMERSITNAANAGIWLTVNFIIGFPGEREEEFAETLDFFERNIDIFGDVLLSTFKMFDFTEPFQHPERFGIVPVPKGADYDHITDNFRRYGFNDELTWKEHLIKNWKFLKAMDSIWKKHKQYPSEPVNDRPTLLYPLLRRYGDVKKVEKYLEKHLTPKHRDDPFWTRNELDDFFTKGEGKNWL